MIKQSWDSTLNTGEDPHKYMFSEFSKTEVTKDLPTALEILRVPSFFETLTDNPKNEVPIAQYPAKTRHHMITNEVRDITQVLSVRTNRTGK